MRVNIDGRGAFPGIGILPARGIELSEEEILRLTNFKNVRVYDASTGRYISKNTIMEMRKKRAEAAKAEAKKPAPVVEEVQQTVVIESKPVIEEIPTPVVEAPLPEIPKEAYVEPTVELDPVVEETIEEAPVEEEVTPVEEVVEEAVVEEKIDDRPYRNNKKKGKKNNRNNATTNGED